ncbi:MAG TPA: hypothetical protein VFD86_07750 [Nitrospira sp.]|nr:hypothetical protein [Nitrospira sp.]
MLGASGDSSPQMREIISVTQAAKPVMRAHMINTITRLPMELSKFNMNAPPI